MQNYHLRQAPGMGLNAFFAYTVVLSMGYSYQFALTAVLLEGLIFLLLTVFNVREAIVDSIPVNIKRAISVGIGLFIALLGLEGAGIVIHPADGGTIVCFRKYYFRNRTFSNYRNSNYRYISCKKS